MRILFRPVVLTIVTLLFLLDCVGTVFAQGHSSHSHEGVSLHFSHPLVSESPSPDTKVRFDYLFANVPGEEDEAGADRHTLRFEAEYAFTPWLSLETVSIFISIPEPTLVRLFPTK